MLTKLRTKNLSQNQSTICKSYKKHSIGALSAFCIDLSIETKLIQK